MPDVERENARDDVISRPCVCPETAKSATAALGLKEQIKTGSYEWPGWCGGAPVKKKGQICYNTVRSNFVLFGTGESFCEDFHRTRNQALR
jgi:hypothetical protein